MPALSALLKDDLSVEAWLRLYADPPEYEDFITELATFAGCETEEDRIEFEASLDTLWDFFARPDQIPPSDDRPEGPWRTWLLRSGRGAGKTRTGAEWVHEVALANPGCRIALVAETAADARDVMVQGNSGILSCNKPGNEATYNPSLRRVTWPNGSTATTYSGDEPGQLRGPQHHCFVAGTKILAWGGSVNVETIKPGDLVYTRSGYRYVIDARSRLASVGRVTFSDGSALVGTADHPIWTSRGWVMLRDLVAGDEGCAITASSLPASAGIDMAVDTTSIEAHVALAEKTVTDCTVPSIGITSVLSLMASKFITAMKIAVTMIQAISNCCPKGSTRKSIAKDRQSPSQTGAESRPRLSVASIAVLSNAEKRAQCRSVRNANPSAPKPDASQSGNVSSVAANSEAGKATIAVSVASTWEPVGQAAVYNIEVDGVHEYFANGILVHNCAWVDELAKYRYAQDTWDNLQMGLRLGDMPRCVVTTTPRPMALLKKIQASPATVTTKVSTFHNRANLPAAFFSALEEQYANTKIAAQELYGEDVEDTAGALWTWDVIDRNRFRGERTPEITTIAVGVDPSGSKNGDECGIVAAGMDDDGHFYGLADRSVQGTPAQWAQAAVLLYDELEADAIVVESNYGGEMTEETLRAAARDLHRDGSIGSPDIYVKTIHSTANKVARANPVAQLYEQGKVHHVGELLKLETEMRSFTRSWSRARDPSPNRMDALVFAIRYCGGDSPNDRPMIFGGVNRGAFG